MTWISLTFPASRAESDHLKFPLQSITRLQWQTVGATILQPASLHVLTAIGERGAGTHRH
jgi:hypothetical protein